jgi:cysteine desulfurase/selenocysteine lyase
MKSLWDNIRNLFPIFHSISDLVYVDNASTTQKPQSVITAMDEYMSHSYANIHRWQYALAEESEYYYNESKRKIAWLIGGSVPEIVYSYNATHACNILAQSLVISKKIWVGDVVLVWIRDHHATIVSWQLLAEQFWFEVKFISIDKDTLDIDRLWLKSLLSNNSVKVVMCSHVSNVTWISYDMTKIHSLLSDDVFFTIDGSQAVPHMSVNMKTIWCHAYIFTGHKMMWPTGIGVLRIDKMTARWLKTLYGWGGIIEEVWIAWCSLVRTADKFEPGTPNLIGAIWLWAACDFYTEHHLYDILPQYEKGLIIYLKSLLHPNKKIQFLWQHSPLEYWWILSLIVDNPLECAEYLAESNICVRAGWHCAHPLLHHLGLERWVVRISVFAYNTREDMEKIADTLHQLYI